MAGWVGGVKKGQNIDYVIFERSLMYFHKCVESLTESVCKKAVLQSLSVDLVNIVFMYLFTTYLTATRYVCF